MNTDPVKIALFGLPGLALLWVLTVAAIAVFCWRVAQLVGLLRRGRPENRFDQLGKRLVLFAKYVLGQRRLFNERSIGLPHFLIFWGFVLYATCFWWALARGLLPVLPLPYPDQVKVVALFLEIFSVLVLIALGVAAARRALFPPPHLHLSWDANFILALIGLLMLSLLFGQGFRLVAAGATASAWSPFGGLVASAFSTMPKETASQLASAMWWVHIVTVLFFLVYLPYSKHLHLLAAPFNVFFGNLRPPGDLSLAGAADDSAAGVSKWEEFTWKQLLNGFSCAECGRCDRACPAVASGLPLEPQQMVQKIKKHMLQTGLARHSRPGKAAGLAGQASQPAALEHPAGAEASQGVPLPSGETGAGGDGAPRLIGDVISEAELWSCTTCLACVERCAVLNEHLPLVIQMRRHLIGQGSMGQSVQDMLANVTRYGNSFGKSERVRAKWTQGLDFKIKDARKEPVEFLWFVGDYASFDPRLEEIVRTTARVFRQAGVDFGILYEGERNAGNDVRRVGEEGLFEMLREKNLQTLAKAQFKSIVTTDPHTYNTLKNEYNFNGRGAAVLHYTEALEQLAAQGRLPLQKKLARRVTYHDPCYLGRYNQVYGPPRRVLQNLGVDLVEMPRHGPRSHCCGAGGGRIWMEDTPGVKERPAENRVREAAALQDVATLVVTCPKDIAMFRDAVKTTGNEGKLEVKDLAELVWEAVKPAGTGVNP